MAFLRIFLVLSLWFLLVASANGNVESQNKTKGKRHKYNKKKAEDCVWNKDTDFPIYPPLLMDPKIWRSILPVLRDGIREVRVEAGAEVVISCPQTTIDTLGVEVTEGVCHGGDVLSVDGSTYTMMELGCTARVKESLQKDIGMCADEGASQQAIGFTIPGYPFYELVRVCFEEFYENTFYTKHILRGRSVTGSDTNPSRPSFRSDTGYYTVSPNTCYTTENEQEMMTDLLGYPNVIDSSDNLYFARGHMAPDADFHTEMEQDATYYYINALPQWQTFNGQNWKSLEYDIRNLASNHDTNLHIWTGSWNVLVMDDVNGNPKDIYLGYFQEEEVIPAPQYMWKVIYENSTNRGVAVMGLNDPYVTDFPTPLCPDICDEITWLDFDFDNLVAGATYCCTVQELSSVVPYAPDLGNAGLLDK